MKAYKVSYYRTDCEGGIPMGAAPIEEYFINEEKANARFEEQKNKGWWIAGVSIKEIEIDE